MEGKSITEHNLNLNVLKTQNQSLVARLNTMRSRLNQLEAGDQHDRSPLINSSLTVDAFTNSLKRLFESILGSATYTNLPENDKLKGLLSTFLTAINKIGEKVKNALAEGQKANCEPETRGALIAAMSFFQALLAERVRFNDILVKDSTDETQGVLKARCDLLEKEKVDLLLRHEDLEQRFADFKQKHEQTAFLLNEITNLKSKVDNFAIRFERLTSYDKMKVEELLALPEDSTKFACVCGGSLLTSTLKLFEERAKEIESYVPKQPANQGNSLSVNGTGNYSREELTEKDVQIKDLQKRNEELTLEMNKLRIAKATLDSKFLSCGLLDELTQQLQEVVNYSIFLKQNLDRAEKNLTEIQLRRSLELNELFDKTNDEKLKLSQQIAVSQRELLSYKERNLELIRMMDAQKDKEVRFNAEDIERDRISLAHLNKQVQSLSKELAEEKEKLRHEHHRVYKYAKEVQNVKDNHYNELLNKYAVCDSIDMRHKRFEETFGKLYKLNETGTHGLKDELDEIVKYVKTREEKVNHLDKKWKKVEKELDAERKHCQGFIKEIESATIAYQAVIKENEQLKKDSDVMNSNFNKIYKEKNAEKQQADTEISKLQNELKKLKEQVPALKTTIADLQRMISAKDKFMNEFESSYNNQKVQLEQANEDRTKQLLEVENIKKENEIKESRLQTVDSIVARVSKETSELRTDVSEKNKIIDQYLKANKLETDIDLKSISASDYLTARIELQRLRKATTCSVCQKREKDSIIAKCWHRFCNECLQVCLNHRERKCPVCAEKFGHQDVKKLYQE